MALIVASGSPGPRTHDDRVSVAAKRTAYRGALARPSRNWRGAIVVDDLGDPVVGQRCIEPAADPERVLGVPPVHQGLQAPAPLPEADGWWREDGPCAVGRISVEYVQQGAGGSGEPRHQGGRIARRGRRRMVASLLGDRDGRPQIVSAKMIGQVVECPPAAVRDLRRQVSAQALQERTGLAAQMVQVVGCVHTWTVPKVPAPRRGGRRCTAPSYRSPRRQCPRREREPWLAIDPKPYVEWNSPHLPQRERQNHGLDPLGTRAYSAGLGPPPGGSAEAEVGQVGTGLSRRPWGSILLCLSPSASPLGAGRAAAGPPRGVCSGARCGTCLAPRLVR